MRGKRTLADPPPSAGPAPFLYSTESSLAANGVAATYGCTWAHLPAGTTYTLHTKVTCMRTH